MNKKKNPSKAVVLSLLIVVPIVGFCNCSICFVVRYFVSILVLQSSQWRKRELVAVLCLSSLCLVIVVWVFLTMPWVCLQFVIVLFPDHTRLLFL